MNGRPLFNLNFTCCPPTCQLPTWRWEEYCFLAKVLQFEVRQKASCISHHYPIAHQAINILHHGSKAAEPFSSQSTVTTSTSSWVTGPRATQVRSMAMNKTVFVGGLFDLHANAVSVVGSRIFETVSNNVDIVWRGDFPIQVCGFGSRFSCGLSRLAK